MVEEELKDMRDNCNRLDFKKGRYLLYFVGCVMPWDFVYKLFLPHQNDVLCAVFKQHIKGKEKCYSCIRDSSRVMTAAG